MPNKIKKAAGSANYQQLVKGFNSVCTRVKAVAQQRTQNHVRNRTQTILCVNLNANQRRNAYEQAYRPAWVQIYLCAVF